MSYSRSSCTIDIEIRHRQGTRPVAELHSQEEGVAARHRDPVHPRSEGGDLGLGIGARIAPVHDDLSAARLNVREASSIARARRAWVRMAAGMPSCSALQKRVAVILARQRESRIVRVPGARVCSRSSLMSTNPPQRSARPRCAAPTQDGKHDESAGTAQHHGAVFGAAARREGDETAGDDEREDRHRARSTRAGPPPTGRSTSSSIQRRGPSDRHRLHAPGRQPVVETMRNAVRTGHDQREQGAQAPASRRRPSHPRSSPPHRERWRGRRRAARRAASQAPIVAPGSGSPR